MQIETLGEKIRTARKAIGMSACELGQKLEPTVTSTAIYKWEKDVSEPTISHMKQLQEILGINVAEIFEPETDCAEIMYYLVRMSETQRDAVFSVARAMVE